MPSEQSLRDDARRAVHAAAPAGAARDQAEALRRRTLKVLDVQLLGVPRASHAKVACAKGCDLCCHLRVMATPVEVLGLADYLQRTLAADELSALAARIADTAARLHALPQDQVLRTNLPCPLLADGACSVYPARPLNCRAYHSLDLQACQASFARPEDLSLTHPQSALIARVNEGVQQGFVDVLRDMAVDTRQYELVTALDEGFKDPGTRKRFARGEPVFLHALQF